MHPRCTHDTSSRRYVSELDASLKTLIGKPMIWSWEAVKMYVHCLTPIFETMRLLRMKSLGECAQLNYGAPRRRIRSNGLQMKELRNLQNRWSSVYANLDLCAFIEQFRPAQIELSHKPNCSTILVHQRSPEKWIKPKNIKGRLLFVQIQNSIYLSVFLSLACRIEFEFQLPSCVAC